MSVRTTGPARTFTACGVALLLAIAIVLLGAAGQADAASPEVASVSPGHGPALGGNQIVLGGELSGVSEVDFGGVPAASFVEEGGVILAVAPPGSGTVDVTVTSPHGTSAAIAADRYTYLPTPVITGISPDHATIGGPDPIEVTITGHHLHGASISKRPTTVRWELTPTEDGEESLVVTVPARNPGTSELVVKTEGGESQPTPAAVFTYLREPGSYPKFGRCTKQATLSGAYSDSKCAKPQSAHTGRYEWLSGLSDSGATFSGGSMTFTSESGTIVCAGATGVGGFDGLSALSEVQLVLHGCQRNGTESCASDATPGVIESVPLFALAGWQQSLTGRRKLKAKPGIALSPLQDEGPFAEFTCGGHTILLIGGLTAAVKPTKPSSSLALVYAAKAGKQQAPGLEDATDEKLRELVDEPEKFGVPSPDVVVTGTLRLAGEEPFELNTKL